jgi:hypothetical protein
MFNCPVCFEKIARHVGPVAAGQVELECQRCGHFKFPESMDELRNAGPEKRALVCSWIWEQNAFRSVPTIDEHFLGQASGSSILLDEAVIITSPLSVNLMALPTRLRRTWVNLRSSPCAPGR